MKISIITVCRNEEKRIRLTLDSVLAQSYQDFELIVIDGASTDGTLSILEEYKDKITHFSSEKDEGLYFAQNKGARLATGKYLLFLNGGDHFVDAGSLQAFIDSGHSADIVYGDIWIDDGHGQRVLGKMPDLITTRHLLRSTVWHPASFIKRAVFERYGPYDTEFKIVADYDFFFKAISKNGVTTASLRVPISIFYTDGIGSDVGSNELHQKERASVQKRYLGPVSRFAFNLFEIVLPLPIIGKLVYFLGLSFRKIRERAFK